MKSARNQKLTDQQIATIKHLKASGYQTITIARVCKSVHGVALSTTYYHVRTLKVEDWAERRRMRAKIRELLFNGLTTSDVAREWNMPLAEVNRLYAQ
jgi:hypothetical protein